jgi:quercetin dioxygenase-like cupin family protein
MSANDPKRTFAYQFCCGAQYALISGTRLELATRPGRRERYRPIPRSSAKAGNGKECAMAESIVSRRHFNHYSFVSLLAAAAMPDGRATAQQATSQAAMRRDVIKQELPGAPLRDISLIEVTYPPATGSPPHLHANGVMAFVVSGAIVSKVGDGAEQTFHAGDAWWEPPGAIHRVSRNASSTEPAILLAIYVAPKNATADDLMKPI